MRGYKRRGCAQSHNLRRHQVGGCAKAIVAHSRQAPNSNPQAHSSHVLAGPLSQFEDERIEMAWQTQRKPQIVRSEEDFRYARNATQICVRHGGFHGFHKQYSLGPSEGSPSRARVPLPRTAGNDQDQMKKF